MKSNPSVLVALDGESKCGKTTIAKAIATQAQRLDNPQKNRDSAPNQPSFYRTQRDRSNRTAENRAGFSSATTLSAGNVFRAAALLAVLSEINGTPKTAFDSADTAHLRQLLAIEGIEDTLQTDPNIGRLVTPTATMAGAQALCGTVFCDFVMNAYHADGGNNLVIVDARDPIGHLVRNGLVGTQPGQVHPGTIIPIYIDTPTEVAAERMPGDNFHSKLSEVWGRRLLDRSRPELPTVIPTNCIATTEVWSRQFDNPTEMREVAAPYHLNNDRNVSLDHLTHVAGIIALGASELLARHVQELSTR